MALKIIVDVVMGVALVAVITWAYAKDVKRYIKRRKTRKAFDGPCPKGGKHAWDVAVHGPGGTVFECVKCKAPAP